MSDWTQEIAKLTPVRLHVDVENEPYRMDDDEFKEWFQGAAQRIRETIDQGMERIILGHHGFRLVTNEEAAIRIDAEYHRRVQLGEPVSSALLDWAHMRGLVARTK